MYKDNQLGRTGFFVGLVALMLTVSCTRQIRIEEPPYPEVSLEEIRLLYQKQQEAIPPLKGLMEVTLDDKFYKGFWAKWRSHSRLRTIEIEGFNLLGGTLFHFRSGNAHVSLVAEEKRFEGDREAFQQYLVAQTPHAIKIEWLTLFDWIARAGLPDLSSWYRPVLEKQDNQFVLYLFDGMTASAVGTPTAGTENKTVPTQTVRIERKTFRVTEVAFFDPSGWMQAKITFDDYRPLPKNSPFTKGDSGGCSPRTMGAPGGCKPLFPFLIKMEAHDRTMEMAFKTIRVDDEAIGAGKPNDRSGY